jgi:hypothetical protein
MAVLDDVAWSWVLIFWIVYVAWWAAPVTFVVCLRIKIAYGLALLIGCTSAVLQLAFIWLRGAIDSAL